MALKTFMYTNTVDEHFVVGRLSGAADVLNVSPCSGHGFKFSPVIAEIVADLVTAGRTRHDTGLFGIGRLNLAAA